MADQQGCPRCKDYESIKEQLENTKSQRDKEVKDKLKSCEDHTKHLQKKLLTVGAAAVIGGTILGKDFVDKIAEYINSFNKVKDNATKLIGSNDLPVDTSQPVVEQAKVDDEEKDEKKDDPTNDPWSLSTPYVATASINDLLYSSAIGNVMWDGSSPFDQLLTQDSVIDTVSLASAIADLTTLDMSMGSDFVVPPLLTADLTDLRPFEEQPPMGAIVPAPGVFAFLPFVFWMGSRRRRR
jgi:hypothetical protein